MTLKLKRTPGLYLVGFMASGKTTVGRAVSEELGWPFVDIDAEIEAREGTSIAQIFEQWGESAFRDLESAAVRRCVTRIEAGNPAVVALGGGAFVQPANWEMIRYNGISVWLDCPIETVHRRLCGDATRPLAADRSGLEKLLRSRQPLYARADYRIEVDTDEIAAMVRKILSLPIF
jgi:shikimate kinase